MPAKKNPAADGNSWILVWSDAVIELFLELLEEAHKKRKKK